MLIEGLRILITAGPTYESIDPVRFVGNHSTGRMGYEVAKAFVARGAEVILISGPSSLAKPDNLSNFIQVTSAQEMYEATRDLFDSIDVFVFSAAVADYTPKKMELQKIKKKGESLILELVKTKDIAKEIGLLKKPSQKSIGFALETENEETNALGKLRNKNFDFIVLNSTRDKGAGFGGDTNRVTIFDKQGKNEFALKSKQKVAIDIVNHLEKIINEEFK